jgi:hypothetical protein
MSTKNTPNTLIINIKTRIPNYYKIAYEPSMTVPSTKSRNVYFNPLVKYYSSIVKNIPVGARPNSKFTQFFEIREFETMINRILSDFRYMQPHRTLNDATNEKIIDNNIKITLDTLFAENNLFYLKNIPYTIIGYKWETSNWEVDIKPIDKLINPYLPISGKEIEIAQKELDQMPQESKQGIAASSNLVNDENLSKFLTDIEDMKQQTKSSPKQVKPLIQDSSIVKNMITGFKKLYGKYLQKNEAVNLENKKDLIRDPLTLSLLVDNQQLLNYFSLKTNESNKMLKIYTNYLDNKILLSESDTTFLDLLAKLGLFKQEFNDFIKSISSSVLNKKQVDDQFKTDMIKLNQYKSEFMLKLFDLYQSLVNIFNTQKSYFTTLVFLLEAIKKNYTNINQYYKKPEIAIKCIDLDITTFKSFITLDKNNNSSVTYFDNIKLANNVVNLFKTTDFDKPINYNEELTKIKNNPKLIEIDRNQYEIYLLRSILMYHYNQLDIWKNYYDCIVPFINEIGSYTNELLIETNQKMESYNKTYTSEKQAQFLEFYKIEGIRLFIDKKKNKKWRLVNSNGEKVIKKDKNIIKLSNNDFIMEKDYIDVVKYQIDCYDMIMLYSYLMEVQCLRQNKLYTGEENIYQIEYEICTLLKHYFNSIKENVEINNRSNNSPFIPSSLMWDTTNFDNINFVNSRIQINYASMTLYTNKISDIHKSIADINKQCSELHKTLADFDKTKLTEECNKIISKSIVSIPAYKTKSTYWLEKEIKNYDVRNSIDLNYQISNIINNAYDDGIIPTTNPDYYQDWAVYDNEGGGDCFFAAVRDALNGQLEVLDASTTNVYTEEIDDTRKFTVATLRLIVADKFTQDNYDFYNNFLGQPDRNGVYTLDPSDEINVMAYKLLVDNTKNKSQLRSFNEVKDIITRPCTYWADELAIQYIQNTLKIVFIIFNMVPRNKDTFMNGDTVIYTSTRKRYTIIETEYIKNKPFFKLQDRNNKLLKNVSKDDIEMYSENLMSNIRIECPILELNFVPKHYIFIAKTQLDDGGGNGVIHYELIRNTGLNLYIYEFEQIPEYIKYFIYENCYKYLKPDKTNSYGFSMIKEFDDKFKEYSSKPQNITSSSSNIDLDDQLFTEHDDIYKKYTAISSALDGLKSIENPDEIVQRDIKNTQKEFDIIQEQLNKINEELLEKYSINQTTGGENKRPSENYYEYAQPIKTFTNKPYYNKNFYSLPSVYPNKEVYNQYVNKMKDLSSKTAYYIDINLELFPGPSVTIGQKLDMKCQSAFENIRQAYSHLFGYQYRPGMITNSYTYENKFRTDKEKKSKEKKAIKQEETKKIIDKSRGGKTRKYKNQILKFGLK